MRAAQAALADLRSCPASKRAISLGRARRADEVALHLRAAFRAHPIGLLLGLDAFGGRRHAQADAEPGDGAHDGEGVHIGRRQIADEAAIDLDLVEGKLAQIAQRGIAGAEIVQRDAHADVVQPA